MGRFVNPDNRAFQAALNSKIYVDKTGLLEYTNSVLNSTKCVHLQQPSAEIWKVYYGKYAHGILQ